jgi:hypothetical protein
MAHVVEKNDVRALTDEAWLRHARSSFDAGTALTSALTLAWSVERETDPWGELSIVVLPASDTAAHPSFVLYEENGSVQVSTFLGEDWQCRQTFQTCQRAVAAIIEAASLSAPNASRTTRARSSVQ